MVKKASKAALCGAGGGSQGLTHDRQAIYHWPCLAPSTAEKVCKKCVFTWVLGTELCLLEEQYMFLATEPSLQLKRVLDT